MNALLIAQEKKIITQEARLLIEEYNDRLTDNRVPIIYNLRHLRKILNIKKNDQDRFFGKYRAKSYIKFKIPKKSGGYRTIHAPLDDLKLIQLWIKENILDKFIPSNYAMGFVKGKSIADNAKFHVGKELVINIDLKDFFPSIKYFDVYKVFKYIGYTDGVSSLLTKLCTTENNVLPQGSPASPALSNLVSLKLDKRLSKLAESANSTYTRYADDITFSGKKDIKSLMPLIKKIIKEEGYTINKNKIRFQYSFQRQEVTGLIVNSRISASKNLINEIENAIYYCNKFGVISHMQKINCNKSYYKEHLYGIAYFIKMIDKSKGEKYLKQLNSINWE